jgi:rubredoxin
MRSNCSVCGKDYETPAGSLDTGNCPDHRWSLGGLAPRGWEAPTPDATRALLRHLIKMHLALLLFIMFCFGMVLCPVPVIGEAASVYALTALCHLAVRSALAGATGYPTLPAGRKALLLWMPLWGPLWALPFFCLGQALRHGG